MQSKSAEDLADLLARHKSHLFSYILSIVHHVADAEDVFQQTCVVAWEKFEEFELGTDFMAWAATIARNKSIKCLQARKREQRGFSDALVSQLTARQKDDAELYSERGRALSHCSQKLPESERQLISACYQRSAKITSVADKLGRPVGSVYDSLSRIRRKLFECIERYLAREETP